MTKSYRIYINNRYIGFLIAYDMIYEGEEILFLDKHGNVIAALWLDLEDLRVKVKHE